MSKICVSLLALAALVLSSCGRDRNPVSEQNGFHVDVLLEGVPAAFQDRLIKVEGVVAHSTSLERRATAGAYLCTTDPVQFRTRPLHVRVFQRGVLLSETVLRDRACRDVERDHFDGFVESISLLLRPDGSVATPTRPSLFVNAGTVCGGSVTWGGTASVHEIPAIPAPTMDAFATFEPVASCSGPGPPAGSKCGRRACGHRDLGPAGP